MSDLAPTTIAAIESLLARRDIADVPGLIRKQLSIVVSRADVIEIYNRIAVVKLGRKTIHQATQTALPVPDDFAVHGPIERNPALAKRYQVSINLITRWRNETGVKAPHTGGGIPLAPMPDGFAVVAPTMTMRQMRLRFSRGPEVIQRWLNEAGVKAKVLRPGGYLNGPVNVVQRDMSHLGQAADFLRRWSPVYRCTEIGRADVKGEFWRRGSAVLTDAELVERAEERGFDPNAWRKVA